MTVEVVSNKSLVTKKVICTGCGYELSYAKEDVYIPNNVPSRCVIVCPRHSCREELRVGGW